MNDIVWLEDIHANDAALVGAKAARLGELRHSFRVSPGFCLAVPAYTSWAATGAIAIPTRDAVLAACAKLAAGREHIRFAVRSSSPQEDQASASFAGQYASFLDVPLVSVPQRVEDCWRSALDSPVLAYRRAMSPGRPFPGMAVLIQIMIDCDAGGVAFSRDPLTGDNTIIIEAAAGAAQSVVAGNLTPHRYSSGRDHPTFQGDDLLSSAALHQIASLALAAERIFSAPQDLEWGMSGGQLYVLQSRPITTAASAQAFFSEPSDPDIVWTAGFLNERFPAPVSPLGWSILRPLIEQFALGDTLRFLGTPDADSWPLTRLWRGHPYTNMRVFQTIYKVFPDFLLPEDAQRLFINRDANVRLEVPFPRGLFDPRFLVAMASAFAGDARNWSPLHNDRLWASFSADYVQAMDAAGAAVANAPLAELQHIEDDIQARSGRLLSIHRLSLTDAEVFYSILRRLLCRWLGDVDGARLAADLATGQDNPTLQINRALSALAPLLPAYPQMEDALSADNTIAPDASSPFGTALAGFIERYGHRSPSLDIYHTPWAENTTALLRLVIQAAAGRTAEQSDAEFPHVPAAVAQGYLMSNDVSFETPAATTIETDEEHRRRTIAEAHVQETLCSGWQRWLPVRWLLISWLAGMARRYLPLRESQRFTWQRGLAVLRRIYLRRADYLAARGLLASAQDVFFLTSDEVHGALQAIPGSVNHTADLAAGRRAAFDRLTAQWRIAPSFHYPAFVQGNTAVNERAKAGSLAGAPISPGVGRGPAVIVLTAGALPELAAGSVLVAPSIDPAWAVSLPHLSAIILEVGGQLSHGAVVARELHLPAVAALAGATTMFRDGDVLVVDGDSGRVQIVDRT